MSLSINSLLQWTGLTPQPEPKENTFLQKINPTPNTPAPQIPSMSNIGWIREILCAMGTESLKAIGQAEPLDMADTLNMAFCLGNFGSTIVAEANALSETDSISEAGHQATMGLARSATAFASMALTWMAVFYTLHHIPRKLAPLVAPLQNTAKNPTETLAISMERKNFSAEHIDAIHQVSTHLQAQHPTLPTAFIHNLIEEVSLGNWQLNHAFDTFNSRTDGEFTSIVEEINKQLPLHESIALESTLQQVDAHALKPLIQPLDQKLKDRIIDLLDYRTARNCACFLSRAIREQRSEPTSFEQKYLHQWLSEYAELHDIDTITNNTQELISVMKEAMKGLAAKNQLPLLKIDSFEKEAMPPSKWSKALEQQYMKELNIKHDHTLHNIEAIPKFGRAILAVNHSLFTLDMSMMLQKVREDLSREARIVIDEALMSLPVFSATLHGLGYRLAEKSSFTRLLSNEDLMTVAPGGSEEGFKSLDQANQLMWQKAKGFVRAHLVTGAPLINVMSPQIDQIRQNKMPKSIRWLQDNIFGPLKIPILPIIAAPFELHPVRVDHFASEVYEAPPMPFNNLSNHDSRLRDHVNIIHSKIAHDAQSMLTEADQLVLAEIDGKTYPMARQA